jgi:exodeoxyribonuclease VII large subunit
LEQIELSWEPVRKTYTVNELSTRIRKMLGEEFSGIFVAGEISGVRLAASGHCYFTLKDHASQLACVCFRQHFRYLKCKPQDGLSVVLRGSIDVYEARGQYQLLVESIEPQGLGALQLAFERLKDKLNAEGLFARERKRVLPQYPLRIGIVTSPTGAVIQDIVRVLDRRFPGLHLRIFPSLVQGEGSVESVCRGIDYFSASGWPEVVIVARGGGSLEDLWTFNEEAVARAIAASSVPVISAVGHETDFTIADFVADLRAPTPSAAAEMVIRTRGQVLEQLDGYSHKLLQATRYKLAVSMRRLHELGIERAANSLHRSIGRRQQKIDEMDYRLREQIRGKLTLSRRSWERSNAQLRELDLRLRFAGFQRRLETARGLALQRIRAGIAKRKTALDTLTAHLTQLSPLKILDRGYAIVQNSSGKIVKAPGDAPAGSGIRIRVADGSLEAKVTS